MQQNPSDRELRNYLNRNIGKVVTIKFNKAEHNGRLESVSDDATMVTIKWDSRQKPQQFPAAQVVYEPSKRKRNRRPVLAESIQNGQSRKRNKVQSSPVSTEGKTTPSSSPADSGSSESTIYVDMTEEDIALYKQRRQLESVNK